MTFLEELLSLWGEEEERCGVILDGYEVVEIANSASMIAGWAGKAEFAMTTDDVSAATRGMPVRGIFHTHPSNISRPSQLDIAGWPNVDEYYIVTKNLVTEWKLVGSNPVLIARARPSMAGRVREASERI